MHTFIKIIRPVDIPRPLESEFPIIPILYVTYVWRYASRNSSTQFTLADIGSLLGRRQVAQLRIYRETLLVCFNTGFARSRCAHRRPKQLIFVTSHMPLRSAIGICGVSLESGTAVRSVPRTSAQIVR